MKILYASSVALGDVINRTVDAYPEVEKAVKDIIDDVRRNGDAALKKYAGLFDGGARENLEISKEEIKEGFARTDEKFRGILERAAENIRAFHKLQIKDGFRIEQKGIILGQKVTPLERVGIYVPGGTASYPSTVLMNAIPAKIAGVKEIIMVTPAKNGKVAPELLAAAKIAGVDRVFGCGGAQAIAALAYGTQSIPKVDKITGPGNIFVALAKKEVFGVVDIDMIAGPSEILIIADGEANADFIAADLLSQAEHDKLASAVLITDCKDLAEKVSLAVNRQLELLERSAIARESIENNGKIIITKDIGEALALANLIAPEHLELMTKEPLPLLDKVVNAGSVFIGSYSPEPLGDYFAGANHTLPTGGAARFSSPLSTDDFVKKTQYVCYSREALGAVAADITDFASKEGLTAHAAAIDIRFGGEK